MDLSKGVIAIFNLRRALSKTPFLILRGPLSRSPVARDTRPTLGGRDSLFPNRGQEHRVTWAFLSPGHMHRTNRDGQKFEKKCRRESTRLQGKFDELKRKVRRSIEEES